MREFHKSWRAAGVGMEAVSCSGHVPPSNQKHQWPLTRAQVRTAPVLQRPLSTWKTILHLMWTSRSQSHGGRVEMHRSLSSSLRTRRGKWWLVSWNSWFHFPAGLGNCPHCGTWCKDRAIPALHWPAKTPKNPLRESLGCCGRGRCETPEFHNAVEPKVTMGATWTSCYRLDPSGPAS